VEELERGEDNVAQEALRSQPSVEGETKRHRSIQGSRLIRIEGIKCTGSGRRSRSAARPLVIAMQLCLDIQ
jgi:hypothetical protein